MKKITITLTKSELLFDIENTAFLVGRNQSDGANFEQVHNIQNTGASEDRAFILRSIETAFLDAKKVLSRYIDESNRKTNNELMDETGDLVITLVHAYMFNEAATDSLRSAIHEYIVSSSLLDWFSIVKLDKVQVYEKRRQAAAIAILDAFFRRNAPQRPVLKNQCNG